MAQVHKTHVVGEEVEEVKEVGEVMSQTKDEAFAEDSVTGDFGMKEYEYSYKDYNEPVPDGENGGDMGHTLASVTHMGGVSHVVLTGKFSFKLLNIKR